MLYFVWPLCALVSEVWHWKYTDFTSGGPSWQNGVKKRPELDPTQYVIRSLYTDGRPHPLLAYGEALFQNAIQGEPCNYTSLGTVYNYNGAVNNAMNGGGYLPFSSALAKSRLLQQDKGKVLL